MIGSIKRLLNYAKFNFIPGAINSQLVRISAKGMQISSAKRGILDTRFSLGNISPRMPLWRLGQKVSAKELVTDANLMSMFFTADAAELLSKCPNYFWFWYLILLAVTNNRGPRVTRKQLQQALSSVVNTLPGHLRELSALPPDQWDKDDLALGLTVGVVLIKQTTFSTPPKKTEIKQTTITTTEFVINNLLFQ